MATIQLGNTKVANRLISYAEKRAEEREGVDCPPEYAKAQFKATRELWGKTDGVQAHHIIQSFKPGEVTPEMANQIGKDLAKEVAKGHECVVYTHTDKAHIHNHIVINAVSYEDGSKYQSSKKDLYKIREQSDRLCLEKGLSIVKEPYAEKRYHRAEQGLVKRGEIPWKQDLRDVIDYEKQHAKSYEDFKKNLTEKYNIEVKERGENISFKHPDSQKFVRGKTLGLAYERGTLENEFTRHLQRDESRRTIKPSQDRGNTSIQNEYRSSDRLLNQVAETPRGSVQADGNSQRLRQYANGQGYGHENGNEQGIVRHAGDKSEGSKGDAFDFEQARRNLENTQRETTEGYGRWKKRDEAKQPENTERNESSNELSGREVKRDQLHERNSTTLDRKTHENRNRELEEEQRKRLERVKTRDDDFDLER